MVIFQIILAIGSVGIVGFILYWVGVVLHAGTEVTKDEVNKDPRI